MTSTTIPWKKSPFLHGCIHYKWTINSKLLTFTRGYIYYSYGILPNFPQFNPTFPHIPSFLRDIPINPLVIFPTRGRCLVPWCRSFCRRTTPAASWATARQIPATSRTSSCHVYDPMSDRFKGGGFCYKRYFRWYFRGVCQWRVDGMFMMFQWC